MPPPPKSPDHVQRRDRCLARPAEVSERTGERDVVDVVACRLGVHALLSPSGHPAEHELGVAGETHVGADAETLHDAGAETLDQRVGRLDETKQRLDALGALQVESDVAATTEQHVEVRRVGCRAAHGLCPVDADDLCAHVGEHHRGERARADACDLDDAVSGEGSSHGGAFQSRAVAAMAPVMSGQRGAGRSWPMSAT